MHMKLQLSWFAIALIVNGILVSNSFGMENGSRDWPTYRSGNDRHGSTSDSITPSAQPSWTFQSPAAPKMSWGSAEGRIFESHVIGDRNKYDDALQPVVVGDQVFFGSSVDHHLHCLDLKTGRDRWSYTVGGPIRLAPTVYNNKCTLVQMMVLRTAFQQLMDPWFGRLMVPTPTIIGSWLAVK